MLRTGRRRLLHLAEHHPWAPPTTTSCDCVIGPPHRRSPRADRHALVQTIRNRPVELTLTRATSAEPPYPDTKITPRQPL